MLPFYVLVFSFVVMRVLGFIGIDGLDHWQTALRFAFAIMFLFTASAHWGKRRPDLIRMVPPALKRPDLLVTWTGILEITGAIGLCMSVLAPFAAIGLAILLIAMFPANVNAAKRQGSIGGRQVTPLPLRILLQIIFVTALLSTLSFY
ncbi:DoxX family protein [Paenibacillus sp. GCM10027628]|uniref:DoxX family protein n=1 Tax=Paenibacillus sp. GCM10027628 TaxID=3273413 RepID=UPI0036445639